ncbi:MAG: tRNA 2-selenouridine(34) synthase MnmH [Bacteroidia bacterium]
MTEAPQGLCLDVRSPAEYQIGHIPFAENFPLFTDKERALVGTAYKQQSPDAALELGLLYVGPKMAEFVRKARKLAKGRTVYLYCWRGGQRSASMAWLLSQAGLQIKLLEGGYKNWRQYVHGLFEVDWRLRVVGGKTGSGKTETLHHLQHMGCQVLDLEAIARHKGSAFGAIDMPEQCSNEHFMNLLGMALHTFDPAKSVWVEDESRMIGNLNIPAAIFKRMQAAECYVLDVSLPRRIKRLIAEYGRAASPILRQGFARIGRKLGGQNVQEALLALDQGDLSTAASIALRYYDRAYELDLKARDAQRIELVRALTEEPQVLAESLLALQKDKE